MDHHDPELGNGKALKVMRSGLGVSQSWIARKMGVGSVRRVQEWEAGKHPIPAKLKEIMGELAEESNRLVLVHIRDCTKQYLDGSPVEISVTESIPLYKALELGEDEHPFLLANLYRAQERLSAIGIQANITDGSRQVSEDMQRLDFNNEDRSGKSELDEVIVWFSGHLAECLEKEKSYFGSKRLEGDFFLLALTELNTRLTLMGKAEAASALRRVLKEAIK